VVSIILPCYKEEQHLRESIAELNRVSKSFDFEYEFIFVDDCSPDGTISILKEFDGQLPRSKFVYHEKNTGRGGTIKSGYAVAAGSMIGYLDIDLEISPLYISEMVAKLDTHDVVIGNRSYFSQISFNSLMRNIVSRVYKRISRGVLKHPYADTEVGFKFFRKDKVAPFFHEVENNHWFWDTEFMMLAFKHKLKVCELRVEFIRNKRKTSTVNLANDTRKYVKELYRYKRRK
jgi:glycosyltransferase AglD